MGKEKQIVNFAKDSAKTMSLKVEIFTLKKVNKELKQKIKELEDELENLQYED